MHSDATCLQIIAHELLGEEFDMGASEWFYFVPYQSNITQALHDLQTSVFLQNDYHHADRSWQTMTFDDFLPSDPYLTAEDCAHYWEAFQQLQLLPEPTTIVTLRAWNGVEGTHSILDIETISATSEVGAAAPLFPEQLDQVFGTRTPTHHQIEHALVEALANWLHQFGRSRNEATYILVYEHETPHEIFFIGYSGD